MITYRVNQQDLNNFVKTLRSLGHIISDPNMQLFRAQKYKEYTKKMVESGILDLEPLSELTQVISGEPHPPVSQSGNLLDSMAVKPAGKNGAEAGYWDSQGKMPGKDITIAGWVRALHTGFRIPLQGVEGARVRSWFWHQHKVSFPASKNWLHVPARPFMIKSYEQYIATEEDLKAVDQYIDKLVSSPIDTTRRRETQGKEI